MRVQYGWESWLLQRQRRIFTFAAISSSIICRGARMPRGCLASSSPYGLQVRNRHVCQASFR